MKRQYKEKRPRLGAVAERKTETSPSFTRILSKHGLCSPDLSVSEAFDLFTRVGADPIVKAMRPGTVVPKTNQLVVYALTAAALDKMTTVQKNDLLERLTRKFQLSA